jgi:hypothetical protein
MMAIIDLGAIRHCREYPGFEHLIFVSPRKELNPLQILTKTEAESAWYALRSGAGVPKVFTKA